MPLYPPLSYRHVVRLEHSSIAIHLADNTSKQWTVAQLLIFHKFSTYTTHGGSLEDVEIPEGYSEFVASWQTDPGCPYQFIEVNPETHKLIEHGTLMALEILCPAPVGIPDPIFPELDSLITGAGPIFDNAAPDSSVATPNSFGTSALGLEGVTSDLASTQVYKALPGPRRPRITEASPTMQTVRKAQRDKDDQVLHRLLLDKAAEWQRLKDIQKARKVQGIQDRLEKKKRKLEERFGGSVWKGDSPMKKTRRNDHVDTDGDWSMRDNAGSESAA